MIRRRILLASCLPVFFAVGTAHALEIQPFDATRLQQAQAAGKPVALHFHATWCPTCRAQEQAFKSLQSDPVLKSATVLVVDYDKERELKRTLGIRSQSTIVVYKGGQEVTRVAGETQAPKLKAALMAAL